MANWEDVKHDLHDALFHLPNAIDMFIQINEVRNKLGFNVIKDDQELVAENNWIIQQYRKYVFTKESSLAGSWVEGPEKVLAYLVDYTENAPDSMEDRKHIIYQALRDAWLTGSINNLQWAILELSEEEDE